MTTQRDKDWEEFMDKNGETLEQIRTLYNVSPQHWRLVTMSLSLAFGAGRRSALKMCLDRFGEAMQ